MEAAHALTREKRIGVNAYYFNLSAGLNAYLSLFEMNYWNKGTKAQLGPGPGRSEPGRAGPGWAVPPRGWYSKYRRNVDQLTAEPGGAQDLIGRDARITTRRSAGCTCNNREQRAGCGLSPVHERELESGLRPSSRFCWNGFDKCNMLVCAHLQMRQDEYFC